VGQTRVDLLLEDLRDAYPGALEETILSEVVANALDSGAARVSVRHLGPDDHLDGEDVVPGFRCRLGELFE
jgi:hypothetical protein